MRRGWMIALLVALLYAALAASVQAQDGKGSMSQGSRGSTAQTRAEEDSAAVEEATEPADSQQRVARKAKNIRYNTGGRDITTLEPGVELFPEHVWPRVEFMPTSASAAVVTGTVVKVQPYLSEDRSRIYTEIEIRVDSVLKGRASDLISAAGTLVIDRLGGVLRLRTGRVVRDDVHIDFLGKTLVGKRYIFFAEGVNSGRDISLIKSYELRDGKVFTNDFRLSRLISAMPGVPAGWAHEATFLEAVRQEVMKEASQPSDKKTGERR